MNMAAISFHLLEAFSRNYFKHIGHYVTCNNMLQAQQGKILTEVVGKIAKELHLKKKKFSAMNNSLNTLHFS